jgi:predicted nucleic acid-binding Zn ribbon protein
VSSGHKDPVRLKDALPEAGKRLGMKSPAETALVFARWNQIVGAKVAEHVRPTSLRGGVLRIRADSPGWATEVSYLKEEIKSRANEAAGNELVSEVKVWSGSPPEEPDQRLENERAPTSPAASDSVPPPPPPADPDEALARARKAWSKARSRTRSEASENPESRR